VTIPEPFAMFLKILCVLTITLSVTMPARTQNLLFTPEPQEKVIADAFNTPYANALLKRFSDVVRKEGDRACLAAKGLDEAALIARGRGIFQRYGLQMVKDAEATVDRSAFEAAFAESVGLDGLAELARLMQHPDVKAYWAVARTLRMAALSELTVRYFDLYVERSGLKFDDISP